MSRIAVVVVCSVFSVVGGIFLEQCNLERNLVKEIRGYKAVVNRIIDFVVHGNAKGQLYKTLAKWIDEFGPRLSGTPVLERAIDRLEGWAAETGLNTSSQTVDVPYWERMKEKVELLSPREADLSALALGSSVSTPKGGIMAQVLVVSSFAELKRRADEANGKIVVFAPEYRGYHKTVKYRKLGPVVAAKVGAVAVLIRTIADRDFGTPHAGQVEYDPRVQPIPAVSISLEDAELLKRMQRRRENIIMKVNVQVKDHGTRSSRNLIVDQPGTDMPNQYVIVSGHTDSWDIGTGAVDDGGGAMLAIFTPIILRKLGLQAKRTVRAVLWTGEEQGLWGAKAYKNEFDDSNIVIAMESDEGVFNPTGLLMHSFTKAKCIVHEVLQLLEPINATTLETATAPGSDISIWADTHIPTAALRNDNEEYFWYHHTVADRIEAYDPGAMDRSLALFAAVSYVVADLTDTLPTGDDEGEKEPEKPLLKSRFVPRRKRKHPTKHPMVDHIFQNKRRRRKGRHLNFFRFGTPRSESSEDLQELPFAESD